MSEPRKQRPSPAAGLLKLWKQCESLPFGRTLFSLLIGMRVPYSGSIGATVLTLEPGHVRLALRDRNHVRNHLGSVHAVALTNLGELASGLAMMAALPATVRGIVRGISIEFSKKARGTLVAESRVTVPAVTGDTELEVTAEVRDAQGEVVATIRVQWKLGLAP